MDKPANIYNVNETVHKDVHKLTSGEKGENFTAIVCCNAEDIF